MREDIRYPLAYENSCRDRAFREIRECWDDLEAANSVAFKAACRFSRLGFREEKCRGTILRALTDCGMPEGEAVRIFINGWTRGTDET